MRPLPVLALVAVALPAVAQSPAQIKIRADRPQIQVSPNLYGIFFEEINQAGDGGIYAELIRNRGMEEGSETKLPPGWAAVGDARVVLDEGNPMNDARRQSLQISATQAGTGALNQGFWGIAARKGSAYKLTLWIKGDTAADVSLLGDSGPIATTKVTTTQEWQRIERILRPKHDTNLGQLAIYPAKPGTLWVAYASLMPADTWKHRANGMRKDLAQHVADMKPSFVRFPGGCYVEGTNLAQAFDWKKSLGALEDRPGSAKRMWGYPSTDGLGYHEYLQWCEDLGAAPLYVANCGMSHTEIEPISGMGRYIEDALDAIEYANGPATTKWGALRAKNGHPKPFNLKYVEIGNENGFNWAFGGLPPYAERYRLVYDAIKKAHPEITTIADVPVPHPMDMVDEHYYQTPRWFWQNATKYDSYDRQGPKIYVGEYAVTQGSGQGNLDAALGEAAFMTGMERNSDIVTMSSYAPLFVNVNNRQWNPDAIVYNSAQSYGTPSYYVQALFANNRPDRILDHTVTVVPPSAPRIRGGIGLMTWNTSAEFKDITLEVDGISVYDSNLGYSGGIAPESGDWMAVGGTFSQSKISENLKAFLKGVNLNEAKRYTLELRARKLTGQEGFIIMLDAMDGQCLQWNIGGWQNTQTAFQRDNAVVGHPSKTALVKAGEWYDIRLEREGNRTRGYLDGKLIEELVETGAPNFAAVVGLDEKAHEIVVKIVNGTDDPRDVQFDITGAKLGTTGHAFTLTGPNFASENTFLVPNKVAPTKSTIRNLTPKFAYQVPTRSLTILRLPIAR